MSKVLIDTIFLLVLCCSPSISSDPETQHSENHCQSNMHSNGLFITLVALISAARAHMEMRRPYPIRSKFDPQTPNELRDYNMIAPLLADGSDYPCKNYHRDGPKQATETYDAGSSYSLSIVGEAPHLGGSCQLALSYDNGTTFKVIKSIIGDCPLASDYELTIPEFSPTGTPILAWTWFNLVGNREMYMNCAYVSIQGKDSGSSDQGTTSQMNTLPDLFVANVGSQSSCETIEDIPVVFPEPGPDVLYGGGANPSTPPRFNGCDASVATSSPGPTPTPATSSNMATIIPTTFSTAYKSAGDVEAFTSFMTAPTTTWTRWNGTNVDGVVFPTQPLSSQGTETANTTTAFPNLEFSSTSDSSSLAQYTAILLLPPPLPTKPLDSFSPVLALSSLAQDTAIILLPPPLPTRPLDSFTPILVSSTQLTSPDPSTSPVLSVLTPIITTKASSTIPLPIQPLPTPSLEAATELPICLTGAILCDTEQSWSICNGRGTGYIAMGPVAPGTVCIDGKIGRAQPFGACTGAVPLRCWDDGRTFQVCDQGAWVSMGAVAPGTICIGGEIVAA